MLRPILASGLAISLALLAASCAGPQPVVYHPAPPGPEAVGVPPALSEQERAVMQAVEEKLGRQDYAGAAVMLGEFLDSSPGSALAPLASLKLAYAYVQLGYFDAAVRLLRAASPESLSRVEVLLLLAEAEEGAGRPREAFIATEEALQRAGDRPVLRVCQEKLKDLGARLREADVEELGQKFQEGYAAGVVRFRQAELALQAGQPAVALEALRTFERDFPGHDLSGDAWVLKAQIERGETVAVAAAAPAKVYTIGVLVPQEGGFRAVGEQVLRGLELAAAVFDRQKAAGAGFRLAVRGCGPDGAAAAARLRELVHDEGALAVVALLGSAHAEAVGREAQQLQVPLLALCQDRKLPTGGFVFRNFLTLQAQVERLAAFAQERGMTRLAIFYPEDPYGREMAALMTTAAPLYGLEVVAQASYNPAQSNVIKRIKRLLPEEETGQEAEEAAPPEEAGGPEEGAPAAGEEAAGPAEERPPFDAVFVPEAGLKALIVLPQFSYANVRGIAFLGPNLWNDDRFAKGLEEFHEEVYFVDGFHAGAPEPAVLSFVDAYRRLFGEEPGYVAAQSYDDARMVTGALEAGAEGGEELAEALSRIRDFDGATGLTSLDGTGEAHKSLCVLTVRYKRITRAE